MLSILFHVAVGNKDRPRRWKGVCSMYSDLARSLESLGHKCYMVVHSKAVSENVYHNHLVTDRVSKLKRLEFKPDIVFTWNGISEGDLQMRKLFHTQKFVYAELGFFDHYSTCYFDFSGTNYKSMNMVESLDGFKFDETHYKELVNKYQKERLYEGRFIFVPLQDESDTQIVKLSPFKTMKSFLEYVIDLYSYDDEIKILFKKHPLAPSEVPMNDKLVEVTENVHHYLPYAENVVGINSTVLFEAMLYHQRILSVGLGIASRRFKCDEERKQFMMSCLKKQLNHDELSDINKVESSWFYQKMLTIFDIHN